MAHQQQQKKTEDYNNRLQRFNERLLDFISDLKESFEGQFPSFKSMHTLASSLDVHSPLAADKAWDFFNQNRHYIESKAPQDKMFDCDDMLGFSTFNINVRDFWSSAKAADKDGETAMTIHTELGNLLKLLDKIHACKPFPTASTRKTVDEKKKSLDPTPNQSHVDNSAASFTLFPTEVKSSPAPAPAPSTSPKDIQKQKQAADQMHAMMKRLLPLAGDDKDLQNDFETMIRESQNAPANSEPTDKHHDIFERMLEGLLSNILPSQDENGSGSNRMQDPRQRAAASALQQVETDDRRRKIREIFKHMAAQQDPTSAESNNNNGNNANTATATKPRPTTKENSRYRIEAHFNYRLLEFAEHMLKFRGQATFKPKSGGEPKLYFPEISKTYKYIKELFEKDNATMAIIKPFGQWAVKHHADLKDRNNALFTDRTKYDNPFLTQFAPDRLWKSFDEGTTQDVWNRAYRIITLATVYHDMNVQGFGDLMDIINEVLEDAQIGYDINPKTYTGHKRLVDSIIDRCAQSSGMERFKNIFGKMQTSGENGLEGILQLVDHLTPNVNQSQKQRSNTSKRKKQQTQTKEYDV